MDFNTLSRLIDSERDFLRREFLAPVISTNVKVRMAGVVQEYKISPNTYRGFGVFKPSSYTEARFVRNANIAERQQYLDLFPRLTFIVSSVERKTGMLFIKDGRFIMEGEIPIQFLDNVEVFDIIHVRFDGSYFWFDRKLVKRDSQVVREQFNRKEPKIKIKSEYQPVYELASRERDKREMEEYLATAEGRIKSHLNRADANLVGYRENAEGFRVEYEVNGERYTSTLNKDLRVVSAGICLTDHRTGTRHDTNFDLQSLVTVIREGQNRGLIHRW